MSRAISQEFFCWWEYILIRPDMTFDDWANEESISMYVCACLSVCLSVSVLALVFVLFLNVSFTFGVSQMTSVLLWRWSFLHLYLVPVTTVTYFTLRPKCFSVQFVLSPVLSFTCISCQADSGDPQTIHVTKVTIISLSLLSSTLITSSADNVHILK